MTQFKVGDRVKILTRSTRIGNEGTVVAVRTPDHYYDVSIPGHSGPSSVTPGGHTYEAGNLQLVKPAPKFKVGDRVTITPQYGEDRHSGNGENVGTVVRVICTRGYHVHRDGDTSHLGKPFDWFYRDEALQYAPTQGFTLRRGDKIVNTKTGRKGHVVEGQDEELWVVDHTYLEETGAPAKAVEEYEHHYPNTYEITNRKEGGPF